MLIRCYYPNSYSFEYCGAKGISVCERWFSLKNFIEDMKDSHGLTLDRRDTKGDYTPENCRWVTQQVNANNVDKNSEGRLRLRAAHSYVMRWKGRLPCRKGVGVVVRGPARY
jgi:hypothetical protein